MTDFPSVAPPTDGLAAAFATARRRRLRTASLTTTVGASLALVVPLLLSGGGQTLLVPEPDPQQPAVTVSHGPDPQDHHGVPNVAQTTASSGSVARVDAQPTTTSTGTTGRAPRAGSGPATVPPQAAARKPYAAGPLTRNDQSAYVPVCLNGQQPAKRGLCGETALSSQTSPGTDTLDADVCNLDTRAATLHYAGSNELDFTVLDAQGREVWRWSRWHRDTGAPHSLVVAAGACTFWSTAWTEVDFQGRQLPAGSYTLRASFLSGGVPSADYTFTLE